MFDAALVHREGDQWLAEFPDAPGCQTFADSEVQLRAEAQEAIEGWLEAHLVGGEAPPRPSGKHSASSARQLWKVSVSASLASALAILWARQERNWTQEELAQRLGVSQPASSEARKP